MTRILKPRSPMNTGSWCLVAFSGSGALAVAADLIGRPKPARALGALTALLGSYLGSYTGVLLACTAVPLWSRSRTILGPAFVATATATGAAATRLTLVAADCPTAPDPQGARHDRDRFDADRAVDLGRSASGVSEMPPRRLRSGRPGLYFRAAKTLVALGISLRLVARRTGPREHELASVMYLAAGLLFRFAWVYAGRASATDDAVVAATARARGAPDDDHQAWHERALSSRRSPLPLPDIARRAYGEAVRRASLAIERGLRRSKS